MLYWRWRNRSSAAALQEEAANHRKVRRSRAEVLSVAEKAQRMRQAWTKKTNESEPLKKCRNRTWTASKPRRRLLPRDQSEGNLFTAQAASGIQAA